MDDGSLRRMLEQVQGGRLRIDDAMRIIGTPPYLTTASAKFDLRRKARRGLPEVVLCASKAPDQVAEIFSAVARAGEPVLGTKATDSHWRAVGEVLSDAAYDPVGRLIQWRPPDFSPPQFDLPPIAVVSAGASDRPIVREAAGVLEFFGHASTVIEDAGVAGLQRILDCVDELERALVVIVVAGMDGALPSVVAGLISAPVIAVPTSVGYGASFDGLSPLLAMLNNCSGGVTVVNIDNGFGAAYAAALIAQRFVRITNGRSG